MRILSYALSSLLVWALTVNSVWAEGEDYPETNKTTASESSVGFVVRDKDVLEVIALINLFSNNPATLTPTVAEALANWCLVRGVETSLVSREEVFELLAKAVNVLSEHPYKKLERVGTLGEQGVFAARVKQGNLVVFVFDAAVAHDVFMSSIQKPGPGSGKKPKKTSAEEE